MKKSSLYLLCAVLLLMPLSVHSQQVDDSHSIFYADPTIVRVGQTYYLTGTSSVNPPGFTMMSSTDLRHWRGESHILVKGDHTYGTQGFWAPQLLKTSEGWNLVYTANEQMALAKSISLTGPYRQDSIQPIDKSAKNIDPFIFRDEDGTSYLYHVRFNHGNYIWVAKFNENTGRIDSTSLTQCLTITEPWEHTAAYPSNPVMEGPTVIKHQGKYYLFYSANGFTSIDYAVGYAVADSPMGPWRKPSAKPVISRAIVGENGSGHGDVFQDAQGQYFYVFHVHYSDDKVSPRRTRIVPLHFRKGADGVDVPYVLRSEVIVPEKSE